MRIAVIGDSISTRNNGASYIAWPRLLEEMIKDGGVDGFKIDVYAIPGLTWKTAHIPTEKWLIGGKLSPVDAMKAAAPYDLVLVMMGVNDRNNPGALADYAAFREALGPQNLAFVAQHFLLPDGTTTNNAIITVDEAQRIEDVYAGIAEPFYGCSLGKLYDMGLTYDHLHPTDTGKQWIASSVYMGLQAVLPLTPIVRNIAWLYALFKNPDRTQFDQYMRANT